MAVRTKRHPKAATTDGLVRVAAAEIPVHWTRAEFQPGTYRDREDGTATVAMRIFAGATVRRESFFDDPFDESLSLQPGHHRNERLDSGRTSVLDNHRRHGSVREDVLGVLESVTFLPDEGEFGAIDTVARLSARPDLEPFRIDVRTGIVSNVSIGYRVFLYRDITEPGAAVRHLLAIDWEIQEASFVPIGADPGASTREPETLLSTRAAELGTNTAQVWATTPTGEPMNRFQNLTIEQLRAEFATLSGRGAQEGWDRAQLIQRCVALDEEQAATRSAQGGQSGAGSAASSAQSGATSAAAGADGSRSAGSATATATAPQQFATAPASPDAAAVDAAVERALTNERSRVRGIEALLTRAQLPTDDAFARSLRDERTSVTDAAPLILERLAASDSADRVRSTISVGTEEGEHVTRAVEDAIWNRAQSPRMIAPTAAEVATRLQGNRFLNRSLIEIGRDVLELNGVRLRSGLTKQDLAAAILTPRQDSYTRSAPGLHTTTDFPSLLANVAYKRLRDSFELAEQTYEAWTSPTTLVDYKPASRVAIGHAAMLKEKREGAEYTYGTFGEQAEQILVADYGRIIAMTRQMMVNDDLDAFMRLPRSFGAVARQLVADLVYAHVTGNTVMADSNALFSAAHGNLVTGSGNSLAAAAVAALSNVRTLARKQLSIDPGDGEDTGHRMSVSLRHLRVPPELETAAEQATSNIQAQTAGNVNPFQGSFATVAAEPRLTDATDFFLMADPMAVDTIEVATLQGENGPVIDSRVGFTTDALEFKVRFTVGTAPIEWRGMYKNEGTT